MSSLLEQDVIPVLSVKKETAELVSLWFLKEGTLKLFTMRTPTDLEFTGIQAKPISDSVFVLRCVGLELVETWLQRKKGLN